MQKQFTKCDRCGKLIFFGEKYMSIAKYFEYTEYSPTLKMTVAQPIDAIDIVHICSNCAQFYDTSALKELILRMCDTGIRTRQESKS